MMDIRVPTIKAEARGIIGMVQYYRDMWPRRSHVLAPLTEDASRPMVREIIWNHDP